MQNTTPIFNDVNQALHVCFLIHSLPPGTVSPTAMVVDHMKRWQNIKDDAPRDAPSVNFSGLNPQEIRGQAAQVVSMVNNLPNKMEGAALKAFYGRDVLQLAAAIEFAQYAKPHVVDNLEMVRSMVLYCLPERKSDEVGTIEDIANEHGVSHRTAKYYIDKTRKLLHTYRKRGVEELEDRFVSGELVAQC